MTLIKSPIAGLVIALETTEGHTVHAGTDLILVESMKMEIPVESEVSGVVKHLFVTAGEQIAEGQPIAEIMQVQES